MRAADKSLETENVKTSGLILDEVMSRIRRNAGELLKDNIDPRDGIFYLMAWSNLAGAELRTLMHASPDMAGRQSFDSSDIVSRKIDLGDGRSDSADEMMMGLIDSVVYPIRNYLKAEPHQGDTDDSSIPDWQSVVTNANEYCLAYNFCQKAIYQRKYLRNENSIWVLEAIDPNEARLLAVSDLYGEERIAERILSMELAGPKNLPSNTRLTVLPRRYVDRLITSGEYCALKTLSRRFSGNFKIPSSMTMAMATTSPGTVSLLDHEINGIAPGKLRDLVSAWILLSEIAELWLTQQSSSQTSNYPKSSDAILIPRKALETLFRDSIPCSAQVASSICSFLSFDGEKHDDLWGHPLIAIGDDLRALFVPSLIIPNTGRVIDNWVESTSSVAQARGIAFEQRVRASVSEILRTRPLGNMLSVGHPDPISLPTGVGEIDLVAVFDNLIIAAELKCRKQPADPAEKHYFKSSVHEAVNQISEASSFLDKNRAFLIDRFKNLLSAEDSQRLATSPILPVVITNQYFCSGLAFSGVPVFQFEYFLQQLDRKPFLQILEQLAKEPRTADTPYPKDFDAVLEDEVKALPLPEYADVYSRLIPAEKLFSIAYNGCAFQERHFRTRSRYDAGTFFSTPGTAFKF